MYVDLALAKSGAPEWCFAAVAAFEEEGDANADVGFGVPNAEMGCGGCVAANAEAAGRDENADMGCWGEPNAEVG